MANLTEIAKTDACPLCQADGGRVIWRDEHLRVIEVDDDTHPGFTRVVWNEHVPEMTQLSPRGRDTVMATVWRVEQTQRQVLKPHKVNLAALGNMVPHLHWHVIPRWAEDSHFPEPVWVAAPARSHAQAMAWTQQKSHIVSLLPEYWATLQKMLQRSNNG